MSSSPRDTAAFELRDALREAGCPVCRLALRSAARLIQSIAYEQVNDIALRKQLRMAGGFCNAHAHQWLREARSVLGTALIYRDVVSAALRELHTSPAQSGQRGGGLLRGLLGVADRASREATCPACQTQFEAEARYVDGLVGLVAADAQALQNSQAVCCCRHTQTATRSGGPGGEIILRHSQARMQALVTELDEVIRKEDYRFRHEPRTHAERTAPARAVAWAAGSEGLVEQ
jgi:hypothetical protein